MSLRKSAFLQFRIFSRNGGKMPKTTGQTAPVISCAGNYLDYLASCFSRLEKKVPSGRLRNYLHFRAKSKTIELFGLAGSKMTGYARGGRMT